MRIGIVGSRSFTNLALMKKYFLLYYKVEDVECIYSGGAKGADSTARLLANELGIEIIEILPDWETYGKKAGYIRNIAIVGSSDEVMAFWDGESKGTKHSIDIAHKKGIPVHIIRSVE